MPNRTNNQIACSQSVEIYIKHIQIERTPLSAICQECACGGLRDICFSVYIFDITNSNKMLKSLRKIEQSNGHQKVYFVLIMYASRTRS